MHESSILNMFEDAWNNPEFISCIFNLFDQPGQYSGSIQAKTPLETIDCLPGIIFTYLYLLQECQIRRGGGIAKTLITRLKLSFSNSDIGSPKKVPLQRRLYGVGLVFYLTFSVSCRVKLTLPLVNHLTNKKGRKSKSNFKSSYS